MSAPTLDGGNASSSGSGDLDGGDALGSTGGATTDLLTGLAGELNDAGVAVYDPTRIWVADDTDAAIVFGIMPPLPDRVVMLTAYKIGGDDPQHPAAAFRVQARTRGNPSDVLSVGDLDDAVDVVFQGLTDRVYGAVHLTQLLNRSSLQIGQDTNLRVERSTNYTADVDLPDTANRSYAD